MIKEDSVSWIANDKALEKLMEGVTKDTEA